MLDTWLRAAKMTYAKSAMAAVEKEGEEGEGMRGEAAAVVAVVMMDDGQGRGPGQRTGWVDYNADMRTT